MTAHEELERIRKRQRILGECVRGDPAWEILLDLADAGPLRTSSVGCLTRIPQTTTLRYLTQLEKDGLIKRKTENVDGRLSIISLTEAGHAAVARCLT